jgi:hypothetical protein
MRNEDKKFFLKFLNNNNNNNGTRCSGSWLWHYAINWKIAGSIPDEFID